jgi:hypothetical protein
VAALLAAAVLALATNAQAPAPQPPPAGTPQQQPRSYPAPTNLKVLPKELTGEQIHQLMHKWEADLGTQCGTCHAADPTKIGPNGRPQLNFADDSKQAKATARMMVTMVEGINAQYIAKIENSGMPVSCGTCHRGHLDPEPYVAPPEHEGEHHDAPPAGGNPPMPH